MTFSLDKSALGALRRLAAESHYENPIAVLGRASDGFANDELGDAFLSNDTKRLHDAATREWAKAGGRITLHTDVCMFERSDVNSEEVVSVDGINFELPPFLSEFLQNTKLFYENGHFVVRDPNGLAVNLPF